MSTASRNTNTNRPVKGKSSQRRNAAKTSNFVDSLSPAGQINRVLGDLENLNGGYHLPIPNNLQKGLELHLTARTLGMAQYTQQVIERYIGGLVCRPVEVNELVTVAELTCKDAVIDPILEALANHVAYRREVWKAGQGHG